MENLGNEYFKMANDIKGDASGKLYIKAAFEYSLSKQNRQAGLSFQLGANIFLENNLNHQAAINYINASKQYTNIDNDIAISTLKTAIKLLSNTKNYKLLANNLETLAILNEKERRFLDAIKSYERASNIYKCINMNKDSLKCLRKISTVLIHDEDYEKAIVHLEKIENRNKDIFFDIGILRLYINNTTICTEFLMKENEFMLTREYFLLNDLILSFDQKNKTRFQKLLVDHNAIFPFQKWQFNLLICILGRI